MDNPIIQTLMMVLGAYTGLTILGNLSPILQLLVTAFAGFLAAVVWMAHYNRPLLYSLAQKPVLGSLISGTCKLAKEQVPLDAASEGTAGGDGTGKPGQPETPQLLLHSDGDFASATRQLKDAVKGHNDVVEALMDQLRRNVQLRDNSSAQVSLPPVGVFVLMGKPGLGKKLLAMEIGYRLYKGSSVSLLDVSDPGARGSLLVSEAKSNPYTTFILENFQSCPTATQEDLLSIISGVPQTETKSGSKVSFRNCFFFLLVQTDASSMDRPQKQSAAGTGHTMVVSALGDSMPLDKRLGWSLHGIYPFVLPTPMEQAEVVALLIQQECKKYNVTLGRVDPSILAREVQVISSQGGFEITPSRISKVMQNRLAAAVANKEQLLDLDGENTQAQRYSQRSY